MKAGGLANATRTGNIVVDPKAWPAIAKGERDGDMSNIVRYIHSARVSKPASTPMPARDGCGTFFPDLGPGYPGEGSEGHYEQDFLQFAKWGFDYVKVDWCGGDKENLDPAVQYAEIARAIARAEAASLAIALYYSICELGQAESVDMGAEHWWSAGRHLADQRRYRRPDRCQDQQERGPPRKF